MFEQNELTILNKAIYMIYNEKDYKNMRTTLLELIQLIIPGIFSTYYLTSKTGPHVFTDPVGLNVPYKNLEEYIEKYEDKDYTRFFFLQNSTHVYRERDVINTDTISNTEYYKNIYLPMKISDSLQMSICNNGKLLGIITVYRTNGQTFSDKEVFMAKLISEHLEVRTKCELAKEKISKQSENRDYKFNSFISKYNISKREGEVLKLLFFGELPENICTNLNMSPHTLKKHLSNIYLKLGIHSNRELMSMFFNDDYEEYHNYDDRNR